jgi:hypothetical protein
MMFLKAEPLALRLRQENLKEIATVGNIVAEAT